jgi:hypothetical protein
MSEAHKHYALYGGMDVGSEPHLVAPTGWRTLNNMRLDSGLRQTLRHLELDVTFPSTVDALVNIPNGHSDYGVWIALARRWSYRLTLDGATALTASNECADPFSSCVYNSRVYYTNVANRVRSTDGARVYDVFAGRSCWTKPTSEELIGDGPFTRHPLYEGVTPVGDRGHIFDWTTDQLYRIYVTKPRIFPLHSVVSVRDVISNVAERFLFGRVIAVHNEFIVVIAMNEITSVMNVGRTLTEELVYVPREIRVQEMPVPSGRYVTVFFDHLVIGAPMYKGVFMANKTMWSHVNDFSTWDPDSSNEADTYTHSEFERADDIVRGVTGLARFGEIQLIFTPSCVYGMEYTGLPRVMRVAPLIRDYGNGLPYAVAELSNACIWCDIHNASFFAFRGEGPEDIGKPIASHFFDDVSNSTEWLRLTKSVINRKRHEVAWLYHSKTAASSVVYDKAIVYDYLANRWSTLDADGVTTIGLFNKRVHSINENTQFVNDDDRVVNLTEDSGEQLAEVAASDKLLRVEVPADSEASLKSQSAPVLETGDMMYASAQTIKEVSSLWIDADADVFNGVLVGISAREFIDDEVVWTTVGLWTKQLEERVLTFQPVVGRILRYRFVPVLPVRGFVFRGFEANVLDVGSSR